MPDSPVVAAGCKAAARALAWATMAGSRAAPPRAIAGADAEMYVVGALKGQRYVIGHTRAFVRRATNFFSWSPIMDVPVTEEQIRTLAFYLWERDGCPEGRSDEYWEKARQQLEMAGEASSTRGDASPDGPAQPDAR